MVSPSRAHSSSDAVSTALMGARGLGNLTSILVEDEESEEEKRQREAKNAGTAVEVLVGGAVGVAIELAKKQTTPTEDIDDLLIKAIDAPRRRGLHSLLSPESGQKAPRSVAPPLRRKDRSRRLGAFALRAAFSFSFLRCSLRSQKGKDFSIGWRALRAYLNFSFLIPHCFNLTTVTPASPSP